MCTHIYTSVHVHEYTCVCVHICIYVCPHVYIHIHTHRNIHKPKHTLINTDTHTSPVDGYTGYSLIFLGHTLCCSAHPGYFFFFYICLTIPLVESQDCILLNLILKIENLPLCSTIGINHGPFHQTLKPSCTPLVRKPGSTPEITYRKHRAPCRHIGSTQKRLVVNTNERLSECDGTPCSLYCKLTLGEDSPGSLAQRKPGDKLDAIHHSPTPAPELLGPPTPHPPNRCIHQVPCRVYLPCQDRSSKGQSLCMRNLEFTSVYVGSGLETSGCIYLEFPSNLQAEASNVALMK